MWSHRAFPDASEPGATGVIFHGQALDRLRLKVDFTAEEKESLRVPGSDTQCGMI